MFPYTRWNNYVRRNLGGILKKTCVLSCCEECTTNDIYMYIYIFFSKLLFIFYFTVNKIVEFTHNRLSDIWKQNVSKQFYLACSNALDTPKCIQIDNLHRHWNIEKHLSNDHRFQSSSYHIVHMNTLFQKTNAIINENKNKAGYKTILTSHICAIHPTDTANGCVV